MHPFVVGPLAYLGTAYTALSPALVGAGAAIGAEAGYAGLSYATNLGKIKGLEKNKESNTIKFPSPSSYTPAYARRAA